MPAQDIDDWDRRSSHSARRRAAGQDVAQKIAPAALRLASRRERPVSGSRCRSANHVAHEVACAGSARLENDLRTSDKDRRGCHQRRNSRQNRIVLAILLLHAANQIPALAIGWREFAAGRYGFYALNCACHFVKETE